MAAFGKPHLKYSIEPRIDIRKRTVTFEERAIEHFLLTEAILSSGTETAKSRESQIRPKWKIL